jgi:regulator of sigma E protease
MMGKMLTGEVSWKNLSGPVTIADYAGSRPSSGLDYYVKFMALVSISLGCPESAAHPGAGWWAFVVSYD